MEEKKTRISLIDRVQALEERVSKIEAPKEKMIAQECWPPRPVPAEKKPTGTIGSRYWAIYLKDDNFVMEIYRECFDFYAEDRFARDQHRKFRHWRFRGWKYWYNLGYRCEQIGIIRYNGATIRDE